MGNRAAVVGVVLVSVLWVAARPAAADGPELADTPGDTDGETSGDIRVTTADGRVLTSSISRWW